MKRGVDWYPRDPIRFLDAVQGWGPELIGAYAVILDLLYARGGATPRDDRHLAGLLGCSIRKARTLTDALIERGKLRADDAGNLHNPIVDRVVIEKRTHSDRLSQAGRKGGKASAAKRANGAVRDDFAEVSRAKTAGFSARSDNENAVDTSETNDLAEAGLKQSTEEIEIHKGFSPPPTDSPRGRAREPVARGGSPGSDSASADALFDAVLAEAGVTRLSRWPTGWAGPAATLHVSRWTHDLGLSHDEAIGVVRSVMHGRAEPPASPRYFDRAMERLAAEKAAPPLVPAAGGTANGHARHPSAADRRAAARRADADLWTEVGADLAARDRGGRSGA